MNTLLLSDTNIWIDLAELGLIETFFKLPNPLATIDLALYEMDDGMNLILQPYIQQKRLVSFAINDVDLQEVAKRHDRHKNQISFPDCAFWVISQKLDCILLTGDKHLRRFAMKDKIETHGTLWVIDLLIKTNILDKALACEALKRLSEASHRFLPQDEIRKRLVALGCPE